MVNVDKLARTGSLRLYKSDEVIFYEDDPGSEMYVIVSGKVEILMKTIYGSMISLARLYPGDFFGEMSLLESMPRSATVRAVEDTVVIQVNRDNLNSVILQQPQLVYELMKGLSSRLRKANDELRNVKNADIWKTIRVESVGDDPDLARSGTRIRTGKTLYPEGHQLYRIPEPLSFADYVAEKSVHCPVCDKPFDTHIVRNSRLTLELLETDFRHRYKNFDPIWYNIWVCPACYYANFDLEFNQISGHGKQLILDSAQEIRDNLEFRYTSMRDIDQVFTAYYLALRSIEVAMPNKELLGRLWLRVHWLYNDVGDQKMSKMAASKALKYYTEIQHLPAALGLQDQRLIILVGQLCAAVESYEEALKHFLSAIIFAVGENMNPEVDEMNRLAQRSAEEMMKKINSGQGKKK
ncbi:MAG: DUF2225 domain-containing protein [Solirubrobacterales bacterium]